MSIACKARSEAMPNSVSTLLIKHPRARLLAFEYSAFAVDGRPDLSMVIYTPATPADADRIRSLLGRGVTPSRAEGNRQRKTARRP